jgi:glycosyltransferase involved in cell wall biosynthesis
MQRWLLVAGDFTPLGGMDRANHALAMHLARRAGAEVHLVTHRAWDDLAALPNVRVHRVARPGGSHLLGMSLLARSGRHWARRLAAQNARVVVNGGNCAWGDINWVHYVHAAWAPKQDGGLVRWAKAMLVHAYARRAEWTCVRGARVVVANSEKTRAIVIERLGVAAERVHTVYYGIDTEHFHPPTEAERAEARSRLGWSDDRPAVVFVGALGDLRKGFDALFQAWRLLGQDARWDARLVVAGAGSALAHWRRRVAEAGLSRSVQFLGFRADIPAVLAGCDILVSPTRYEAYGLNVQEALCCGLPALVSASAGVAERYPPELHGLLLPDPIDAHDLAARLRVWREARDSFRALAAPLGQALRLRTWERCAGEIVELAGPH